MIVDLENFIRGERPYWDELETLLKRLEEESTFRLDLTQSRRFYYLYRRAASDLARLSSLSVEPSVPEYLQDLVARAYAEIHETRRQPIRFHPVRWFLHTFPQAFRRHSVAFAMAVLVTTGGVVFGAIALAIDSQAKGVIMPFPGLLQDPSERVADEERVDEEEDAAEAGSMPHTSFASMLMTNNIRVSITALALGVFFGFGTLVVLFSNGVIIGAVLLDYIRAGETAFLAGWLLPHGAIEIPAILFAGQAGFVLGGAIIGWGSSHTLQERLRLIADDLVTIIGGVAVLLVWAGLVESFFSQYHEPVFPYALKIAFGLLELFLLIVFLVFSGRATEAPARRI